MREGFSVEQKVKEAIVPLMDEGFLADFMATEEDHGVKSEEKDFAEHLKLQREYEEIFKDSPISRSILGGRDKALKSGDDNFGTYVCDDEDYRHATRNRGWPKYWTNKLVKNLEKIPPDIARIVTTLAGGVGISHEEHKIFTTYVNGLHKREFQKRLTNEYDAKRKDKNVKLLQKLFLNKRQVIDRLKDRLKDIDAGLPIEHEDETKRRALYIDENGKSYTEDKGGNRIYLTDGDLVADMFWGVRYKVASDQRNKKAWRHLNKILEINRAKQEIARLYDEELRLRSFPTGEHSGKIYKKILKGDQINRGILSEYMVYGILKRLQYVHGLPFDFKVERPNALEDTKLKCDLKIFVYDQLSDASGDRTDSNNVSAFGLQLSTVNINSKKMTSISKGMERINSGEFEKYIKGGVRSIIPLRLSFPCSEAYKRWIKDGKLPGGPEAYLSPQDKKKVIFKILSVIPSISNEELVKFLETPDWSA